MTTFWIALLVGITAFVLGGLFGNALKAAALREERALKQAALDEIGRLRKRLGGAIAGK